MCEAWQRAAGGDFDRVGPLAGPRRQPPRGRLAADGAGPDAAEDAKLHDAECLIDLEAVSASK